MNITGYKKKKKMMTGSLKFEEGKDRKDRNENKISRLEDCIKDCSNRIIDLQKNKKSKRR